MVDRPDPARIVADADVLSADVLVGGPAREAMDIVRSHTWIELVASDELLADASWVIAECADRSLADDWLPLITELRHRVDQPTADHPAVASAYHGGAAHLLSFDDDLRSVATGATLRPRVATSVKHPAAFVKLFDPGSLYEHVIGGDYPGPDRDSRA